MAEPGVWPTMRCADARAQIDFLTATFGFTPALVVEEEGLIVHAQLRWPYGGGVMLGDTASGDAGHLAMPTGPISVYCVTDEPDALHDRAVAAGATIVRSLRDEDYGSRGFTATDPEGNVWSFGTYAGD